MKKLTPLSLLIHALMFILALSWLYPFVWMVVSSLKPTAQIYTTDLFSGTLTLENYTFLFDNSNRADKPFLRTLFNSLFVSVTVTASVTVTSMLVGYALAKTEFWGKNAFRNLLIVQMVFPVFMFIIPQFVLMRELGLINRYSAMILPYAMSAWGIFMVSRLPVRRASGSCQPVGHSAARHDAAEQVHSGDRGAIYLLKLVGQLPLAADCHARCRQNAVFGAAGHLQ